MNDELFLYIYIIKRPWNTKKKREWGGRLFQFAGKQLLTRQSYFTSLAVISSCRIEVFDVPSNSELVNLDENKFCQLISFVAEES